MTRVKRAEASWHFNSRYCDSNQGMGVEVVPVACQGDRRQLRCWSLHSTEHEVQLTGHGTFSPCGLVVMVASRPHAAADVLITEPKEVCHVRIVVMAVQPCKRCFHCGCL